MKKQLLITLLLFIGTMNTFSQLRTVGTDSERNAEYKKTIGLDTTVPDFDTNKIDAQVMGSRLANLLNYLLENYHQESYELQIAQILSKQNEDLQHLYYKIKKMQFANASKQDDIITVTMNVWSGKNQADINQTDLIFRFVDGASDDLTTNALFSYMSRYVEAREALGGIPDDSNAIVTNSFWDNWYAQIGGDMILLFPSHHKVKDVFPNGKSLGVSIAVGKWFSPIFGGKFKANWNNVIIRETHNVWYKPYGKPGGNHDEGGFMTFSGDMMLNMHNLIGDYKPERKWNLSAGVRAGGWLNVKEGKGGPILGVGLYNTYRLSDRWKLFADLNYTFVPSMNSISSGKDHGGNSYAELNVGVEMALSKNNTFYRVSEKNVKRYDKATLVNSFWDNFFVQAGIGMSLQNPYGTNFANVFPNGHTFGINFGLGKWFTPEIGVRGGVNWQNGIIRNADASYLAPNPKENPDRADMSLDKRGFYGLYADVFFNLHHIISGYSENQKWNAIVFPRMGLCTNFSSSFSECPLIGIGTEHTFAISDRMKIFADLAYQVMTSGFHDTKSETPNNGISSNGWLDFNVGVQYELGQARGWKKMTASGVDDNEYHAPNPIGHNWPRFIVNTGASVVVAYGVKSVLKKAIKEERPDGSDKESFPSGHATMAFAAARSIDKEFRNDCIWIPIAGYAAATAVGIERIANKHHHWYDVLAGAAIGIGSAELTWWLSDLIIGKGSNVAVGTSGNTVDLAYKF